MKVVALRRRPAGGDVKPAQCCIGRRPLWEAIEEKAAYESTGRDQKGERKRSAEEASKNQRRHQNRGMCKTSGRVWRVPVYWPGGVRREGGASLICGYYTKRGKACADTVLASCKRGGVCERECVKQQKL